MKRATFLLSLLSSVPAWLVPWRGVADKSSIFTKSNPIVVGLDPAFSNGDSTFMTVMGYDRNGVMHTETIRL